MERSELVLIKNSTKLGWGWKVISLLLLVASASAVGDPTTNPTVLPTPIPTASPSVILDIDLQAFSTGDWIFHARSKGWR